MFQDSGRYCVGTSGLTGILMILLISSSVSLLQLFLGLPLFLLPCGFQFCKSALNVIDLVAITPYFVTLVLLLTEMSDEQAALSLGALRILRLVRVLRILQLTKHVKAMRLLSTEMSDEQAALSLGALRILRLVRVLRIL
ncbi:optic nerve structural organization [Branchiostoma belcheri]|nr:optic nerve structural organization [Branchiostoma belcheri]